MAESHFRCRYRHGLPHFEADGANYFITFRLADSLPANLLEELRSQRERLERELGQRNPALVSAVNARIDAALDAGAGACQLKQPSLARVVEDALHYFDGQRYRLIAWCVMPNHVHVLVQILRGHDLARIVHSWKSFTAHRCNSILEREGRFWQAGYFDRIVRNEEDLGCVAEYIVSNPGVAGLKDWPFAGYRAEVVEWEDDGSPARGR